MDRHYQVHHPPASHSIISLVLTLQGKLLKLSHYRGMIEGQMEIHSSTPKSRIRSKISSEQKQGVQH